MMCFQFSYCDKTDEPSISPTQVSTVGSLSLEPADCNGSGSGSGSNYQSVRDPTTKLRKSKYYPSFSRMPSNLREFKFSELKSATKNFSLSAKLGEGGFGSVYTGTIKNPHDTSKDFNVAVKQLGKRGFQAKTTMVPQSPLNVPVPFDAIHEDKKSPENEGKVTTIDGKVEDSAWFSGLWSWKPSITCLMK
ncbi:hypothetical protein E3N88_13285 [Mikania micrantha]|uniref:Protein kinase domain-containing protein n=1 Tax=Mikania micrantha TaxID=192012 RepID=A0A5N6PAU7_9ASTR|nr:hypothetical protein E3N88_13285 [Mikania micrantha]